MNTTPQAPAQRNPRIYVLRPFPPVAPAVALDRAGIPNVFYSSPGTDHEWQTWRRSLHDVAPRLFRD